MLRSAVEPATEHMSRRCKSSNTSQWRDWRAEQQQVLSHGYKMLRVATPTWPATCLVCLAEPVLLLREWPGLNVLAGDLSKPLITDWLLLSGGGGGHTWGSIGSTCWGKRCMEFVMGSEVVVCHGREHGTEGKNKQSIPPSIRFFLSFQKHSSMARTAISPNNTVSRIA